MSKKFNIEVEMQERWIPYFMSFLKEMEWMGNVGSSDILAFYVDGDGDFRPMFKTDVEFEKQEKLNNGVIDFYDAG